MADHASTERSGPLPRLPCLLGLDVTLGYSALQTRQVDGSVGLGCLWYRDRDELLAWEDIEALAGYGGWLSMWEVRTWKFISFRIQLGLKVLRWGHHLPAAALWNIRRSYYKLRWSQFLEPLLHLMPTLYFMLFQSYRETLFAFVCLPRWVSYVNILCTASAGTLSQGSIFHCDYTPVGTIHSVTLSGVHAHYILTITSCCDCGSAVLGILQLHWLSHAYWLHLTSCRVLYWCLWPIGTFDRQGPLHHIMWILDLLLVHPIVGCATATRLL